jgi:hypothetical protein
MLYFTAKLRGNGRGDVFSAGVPAASPLLARPTNFFGQPVDAQYQGEPGSNAYTSQWAEVLYALVPNDTFAGGTPLYSLYRLQFVVVPDNSQVNNQVPLGLPLSRDSLNGYYEMSCWPIETNPGDPGSAFSLYFNVPGDLTNPTRRTAYSLLNPVNAKPPGNAPATALVRGPFSRLSPGVWSAGLLLSDVVSFHVRALTCNTSTGVQDPYFIDLSSFDTCDPRAINPDSAQVPPGFVLKALQISVRIWELKTQQTRQITIIQDL